MPGSMLRPSFAASLSLVMVGTLGFAACQRRSGSSTEAGAHVVPPLPVTSVDAAPKQAAQGGDAGRKRASDVVSTESGDVVITPLHHATFLIEFAGRAVYFDPTREASYEGLPKAAAVFVTDVHADHMDGIVIEELGGADVTVITSPAVAEKLPKSLTRVKAIKNGQVSTSKSMIVPLIPSLGVDTVPMYNKQRGPAPGKLFHDKGRGNGYVLSFGNKRFYVSGDTECIDEMKALKDIDVAFVCMNLPYTMPPVEAAQCLSAFGPKVVYPYHHRGSNLTELESALRGQPIEVRLRSWY